MTTDFMSVLQVEFCYGLLRDLCLRSFGPIFGQFIEEGWTFDPFGGNFVGSETTGTVICRVLFGWNVFPVPGSECRVISLTLWATKLLSLFCRCIQSKTTILSVQNFTIGKEQEKALRTIRRRRTPRTAASSSSFGMLFCLIGETRLFPMKKVC